MAWSNLTQPNWGAVVNCRHRSSLLFVILFLVVLLCGCSDNTPLQDYPGAIEHHFNLAPGSSLASVTPFNAPKYPQHRALYHEVEDQGINWLQFADLHQCDLGDLVGRRNSGLGRLATDSQRLLYEIEFLKRVQACVSDDRAWLDKIVSVKRKSLRVLWWNALFAGPEMRRAMASTGKLEDNEDWIFSPASARPMNALLILSNEASTPDELESLLQQLAGTPYGLRIDSWHAITRSFLRVSHLLASHGGRACLNGSPTNRSRALAAIFRRYALPMQNGLASQLVQDRQWLDSLNRGMQGFGELARPAQGWLDGVNLGFDRLESALATHQQAWQIFLDRCGMGVQDLASPALAVR